MRPIGLTLIAAGGALLALASPARATDVGPGDVSGTWDVAGAPYVVQGHIVVPDGDTLTIDPGVEITFNGPYALRADGVISAVGTVSDTILFTTNTPGEHWAHIQIDGASDLGTHFAYCRIEYSNALVNSDTLKIDGGGIYVRGNCGAVIEYSTIAHCHANLGGGIYAGGDALVEHCTVRHCESHRVRAGEGRGGGVYLTGEADLHYATITDNVADFGGGGVSMKDADGELVGCVICRNHVQAGSGGGLECYDADFGTVTHNVLYDNTVGPAAYSKGGGVNFWNSSPALIFANNTIVGNSAPAGAGMAYGYSTLNIDHSIIAFNEGEATYVSGGSYVVAFNCVCVYENAGDDTLHGSETNCVEKDPLFCGMAGGNLTLCSNSPCAGIVHRQCGPIGALGVGCGECSSAVEPAAWGVIKAMFR